MSGTDPKLDQLQDLLDAIPVERDRATGRRKGRDGGIGLAGYRGREFVLVGWMNRTIRHAGVAGRCRSIRGQRNEQGGNGRSSGDPDRMSKVAVRVAADRVFSTIGEAQANGDEVRIAGFGTFASKTRLARTSRNLRTGEAISISASKSPSFKGRKVLRDAVNADLKS